MTQGKEETQGAGAERRIIVDEDWKAHVQAERECEAQAPPASEPPPQRSPLPPASLPVLLATLATQALAALGVIPDPVGGKTEQDLDQARHLIDLLGVLEEKTRGNLTPDEKRYLDSLLFDLRMRYVEATRQPSGAASAASAISAVP